MQKTPNPIDTHVGRKVRTHRILLGLSQKKLAHALGVSFQQVQKYEKGSNRVSASRLQMIARIMGVEPSFFFSDAPPEQATPADEASFDFSNLTSFMATAEGVALAEAFQAICSPHTRKRVIDLVEAIAPD